MRQIILYISLFFLHTASAQTTGKFKLREYTTENGLPSNGIKGLQWDKETGFLWLATEAGIVRFNGISFKTFSKENTGFITAERMQFLIRNYNGTIYAADQLSTTFSITKNKLRLFSKLKPSDNSYSNGLYALSVSEKFFDHKRNYPGTKKFTLVYDKVIPVSDTSMLVINNATVSLQTMHNRNPAVLDLNYGKIRSGFKINNDVYFVNDDNELFSYDPSDQKLIPKTVAITDDAGKPVFSDNTITIWETGMDAPVLINKNQAWILRYNGDKITAGEICDIIPTGVLIQYVQYSEEHKLLFIGTNSKGLMVISQNRVDVVKDKQTSRNSRNAYYSQIELPGGNILTNEGNIIGLNKSITKTLPIKGKFSFNISQSGDSVLWYSQVNEEIKSSCLYSYHFKTGQTKIYKAISAGAIVVRTLADKRNIVVSEFGIGELINDSLHFLHRFTGLKINNEPGDVLELQPGVLLIARRSGLVQFNITTNKIDTVVYEAEFSARSLFRYGDYVFIGTYGKGFYVLKNGRLTSMPVDKNNYLLYTHCFMPDKKGYCWISTNRGLFVAKLDELISYSENKTASVYYHYYGKNDGMDITEMNGGCLPCALALKNGTISFPTMDGLLWVHPEKAYPTLPYSEIFIDGFSVDNKTINIDSLPSMSLDPDPDEIVIQLGISAWYNEENIYLDYQLNDTVNWKKINTANNTLIRLNKLSSGKYVLRIRKLNGFGKNNYTYKTIGFTIATPWYKQWWFYALIVSAVLGMFILFYRVRTKQLKINQARLEKQVAEKTIELQQKNEVLEKSNTINTRLISIISHDIITPLKFLNVAGKNLLEKKSLMTEDLKDETIKEITSTSKELQLLSTNILNWIKYQNENRRLAKEEFNIHEMLKQIFGILNSLANQKNLVLNNAVDPELKIIQFFEPLKILIYNLITNAIHFSEKGDITIDAAETDKKIIISVRDEGVGMTPEQIKNIMADQFIVSSANIDNKKGNGLGYLIIKDLIKMMHAKLSINSEKGKGTTVYVELPK